MDSRVGPRYGQPRYHGFTSHKGTRIRGARPLTLWRYRSGYHCIEQFRLSHSDRNPPDFIILSRVLNSRTINEINLKINT